MKIQFLLTIGLFININSNNFAMSKSEVSSSNALIKNYFELSGIKDVFSTQLISWLHITNQKRFNECMEDCLEKENDKQIAFLLYGTYKKWWPFVIQKLKSGDTVLRTAINNDNEHIVRLLLKCPLININETYIGLTALHEAVTFKKKNMVQTLFSYSQLDVNGGELSALHHAIAFDIDEMVHLLLTHPHIDVNKADINGNTPLHRAMGFVSDIKTCPGRTLYKDLLLAHPKIDLTKKNKSGHAPLDNVPEDIFEAH